MSLLNAARGVLGRPESPKVIPLDVKARMDRGGKAMRKDAPKRRLCMRFRKGDTYWYLTSKNLLNQQALATNPDGTGKPAYRIRNRYDFLGPIIDGKVSAATSRIPSFQVNPTTPDGQRVGAAKLSEKVLLYGYDQWRWRKAAIKATDLAVGGGGRSYTMPYFDPNVGPYVPVVDPDTGQVTNVGQGEVKLLVLSGNEAYGEPGVDFNDSKWYVIERARPKDEVEEIPGYVRGPDALQADASTSDIPNDRQASDNLVMVTEYFERPSPKFPEGRCMTFANGRPIVDYRLIDPDSTDWWGDYPLEDTDGQVLDEPILHELVYRHDPENGSELGLTWHLIDFQRTIQDVYNKILEWKNRCLFPQMKAPVGSIQTPRTDEPGAVVLYKPSQFGVPEWETIPTGWLQPLLQILDRTVQDMRDVAASDDANPDPRVAATTVQAVGQQNTSKWESFLGDVAEWHSRVGRHALLLVAKHYTEPRLLKIRGRWGQPQMLRDFQGAHLLGEVDVTVAPDSLVSRSRAQIQQELAFIQSNFPGYLSPEVTIAAMHNGTAEDLIQSYDLDMGRVNDVIRSIVDGTVMEMPDIAHFTPGQPDPATGLPGPPSIEMVPSYMPTDTDSVQIWKRMFGDWMKTQEFFGLDPAGQEVANQIWSSLTEKEMAQAVRAQQLQEAQAQGLGLANAAAPQTKGVPSQPGDGVSPQPQSGAVGTG